jgi:HSP20 family molecular chaperone IbpA
MNLMSIGDRKPYFWGASTSKFLKDFDEIYRGVLDLDDQLVDYSRADKIELDLPGVKKEDLKITVLDSGALKIDARRGKDRIVQKIFTVGSITKVEATLELGVLTLNLIRPMPEPSGPVVEIK